MSSTRQGRRMSVRARNPAGFALALVLAAGAPVYAAGPVSTPGSYSGYSAVLYDGHELSSRYVTVRDGTRIAIDILRPTLHGVLVDRKLPVVWMNTPYNRRRAGGASTADTYPGAALGLVKYGYVVAVADMRGNHASFGTAVHSNRNEWMPWAYWDAYDITEWLAVQPWSDSRVGMWGCSATGHSQWQAAASDPPHLKAIFPLSAPSEYYDWGGITAMQDPPPPLQPFPGEVPAQDAAAVPVDDDRDGQWLRAAREEHRRNLDYGYVPFRDSTSPELAAYLGLKDFRPWLEVSTLAHFADLNRAAIPAYQTANFGEDQRVKVGVAVKMRNLAAPLKTMLAPGNHCDWSSDYQQNELNVFNINSEELRWFDYWLKGIENGIMDEPPIHLYTYNLPPQQSWRFAWQWPLPTATDVRFYLGPAATDSPAGGVNNGSLAADAPPAPGAPDRYAVDYGVTRATMNQRGLTYTTPPLPGDTTLIGHPVVHLWISSTATDNDFAVYLADVAADGTVTVLPGTDDGRLRASHRRLSSPEYDNLGLPYHRSFAEDIRPLVPGEPVELVFDMAPISWVFKAGHRVRLIIVCSADAHRGRGPAPTPVLSPVPVVSIHRDAQYRSYVSLPVNGPIPATARIRSGRGAAVARIAFPPSLDERYVRDMKRGAIRVNGMAPAAIRIVGSTIVAEFPPGSLKRGQRVVVEGEFGEKFSYGEQMKFSTTATVTDP
ncbi:MAG: CocE/NonD family hydrolase [Gammaproteobacteria bacterium]|nr:CocE/NonD family hydrolase [Gammaproteobacteria bacterium]